MVAKKNFHSTKVTNKARGLPAAYVDLLIAKNSCQSLEVKKQLKKLLMKGGSISSYASDKVDRGVLYRAMKRFDKENEFVQASVKLLTT